MVYSNFLITISQIFIEAKIVFLVFVVETFPRDLNFFAVMAVSFQKYFSLILRSSLCLKQSAPTVSLNFARYYASKKGEVLFVKCLEE